ncbi:MAG TPA: response regulator [Gemmatimonadales bacterium]|jgi:two-component system cell cycle sensor histidine kinase/response regulator CckA
MESVLVVDDEPGVRQFASRVLREAGYGVTEAADGVDALRLIRTQMMDLDAVVSDIVMPRMNGVELLQSLSLERPRVPVILMSGYGTDQLNRRGIVSPCGVLAKPFPPELLLAEVKRCIQLEASGPGA